MMGNRMSRLWHPRFEHLSGCVMKGMWHGVATDKVGHFGRVCISGVLAIGGCNVERYHRGVSDCLVDERLDAPTSLGK